jgi:excinuclease UvrABC nuclease subunit
MNGYNRSQLASEVRATVPRAPGVYAFCDAGGRLLYIGKSVNLPQRMTSYLRQDLRAAEPRLGQLVASIRSFAWWQTPSELLSLLLEDVLIKQYLPPINIRQKEFTDNRYLELTRQEFPACRIVEHTPDFGEREIFGPLRDKYFAAALQDILQQTLGIRTCDDPEPSQRCLQYDLGRCAGPCRGELDPEPYQEVVGYARDFLAGNGEVVLDRLFAARDRAAAERRFEAAAHWQDAIQTCHRYQARQRFARRFMAGYCRIHSVADGNEYCFVKGALDTRRIVVTRGQSKSLGKFTRKSFLPDTARRRAVAELHQSPISDRRFLADRTWIIYNWLGRQGDRCQVSFPEGKTKTSSG